MDRVRFTAGRYMFSRSVHFPPRLAATGVIYLPTSVVGKRYIETRTVVIVHVITANGISNVVNGTRNNSVRIGN